MLQLRHENSELLNCKFFHAKVSEWAKENKILDESLKFSDDKETKEKRKTSDGNKKRRSINFHP